MEQRYSQEELAELREEVNRKWREAFNLRLDALDKTVNGLIDQMQDLIDIVKTVVKQQDDGK